MKKYFFFPLLLSFVFLSAQQTPLDFSQFDRSGIQTDILLTAVNPFSVLQTPERSHYTMYDFINAWRELAKADKQGRLSGLGSLEAEIENVNIKETVRIGFIHTEYETLNSEAAEEGKIALENNRVIRKSGDYIFNRTERTLIAPLAYRKKGLKTVFLLDSDFTVNTTDREINSIEADFDDGSGFKELQSNQAIEVKYSTEGRKELKFRIQFSDGTITEKYAPLLIDYSNADLLETEGIEVQTITSEYIPNLTIYGETDTAPGVAEYEVYLSSDGILDKPIFVIDGFDPGDTRGISAVYDMLNYTDENGQQQNLADYVRNEEGFDVVIINFPIYVNDSGNLIDGGADYIERNALSVATIINLINAQKVGNEQNVLIGPSMGGLISRYALRYMEMNGLNHDSRLWVSFDSPHNGANVPISLQHLFNYFGFGYPDLEEVKVVVNMMLRSKAAMQMLVDHLDAHGSGMPLTPGGAPGYFEPFQNRMTTMGYPEETRNISITNGSGTGKIFPDKNGNPVTPGFAILDGTIDTGTTIGLNTRVNLLDKFMPYAGQTQEITWAQIQVQILFWVTVDTFSASGEQWPFTNGVDSAPGGLFDLLGLAGSVGDNPILLDFIEELRAEWFDFIPTTSAMALYNQPNYYYTFNLGEGDTPWDGETQTHPETPFVNWFMADENEGHVDLTPGNVEFVLCELIEPEFDFSLSSPDEVEICEGEDFSSSFSFEVTKGCFAKAGFEVTGNPEGSTVSITPEFVTGNATVTLTGENFSTGEFMLTIIPEGKSEQSIDIFVLVNENNPDLSGTTAYSLDGGNSWTEGESVTVEQGTDVRLRIDPDLFEGTANWIDPEGTPRGEEPVIENIQYEGPEHGMWSVELSFDTDCGLENIPVVLPFELIVEKPMGVNDSLLEKIKIYPNPSEGWVYANGLPSGNIKVTLRDASGRIISKTERSNDDKILADLSAYPNGVYFLQLELGEEKLIKKIIKE